MKRAQLIAAGLFGVIAVILVIATGELEFWSGISPGPRFVPLLVAGAMVCLTSLFAWEAARRETDPPMDLPQGADARRVVYLVATIVAFAILSVPLGLVVASFVFILVTLLLVLRQPVLPSVLTSLLTVGVIYSIFVAWLQMRLPVGIFGF